MVATFAPAKQFLVIGNETAQGTAVAGTFTQLIDSLKPSDKPTFLKDRAWRGSMGTDAFNQIAGVKHAEVDLGGPVFADGIGFLLRNILGDVAVVGTSTGSGGTTLSAQAAAGATSITTVASIPASTVVQIGSGATAEVFTTGTPTGTGPYTIPLTTPTGGLVYAHASAQAVQPVTGPYTYAWSLLNSGGGQPISHTLTHYLGPTATVGARAYPGFCMTGLDLKFNAESELLVWSGKGVSWPSVAAAATPTANGTAIKPIASWQTTVGIGGPASGGTLVSTVTDGEINLVRQAVPIFTATGVQTPYIIQRGEFNATGKLNFSAVSDESALNYMLNNTQPQVQIITSNGLTGTNLLSVQIDMQQCAFVTSDPDTAKTAVGYQTSFEPLFTTTNAGGSGGMSPIKISVTCNVTPGTY
ncbi:hypothetical protein [Streptomyces sp. NPDC006739]|uniref:hypothetical protein n=1 Tax=Streptomyces sp. NPDC006739 TaxID=3364763 RepID=UPI0036867C05